MKRKLLTTQELLTILKRFKMIALIDFDSLIYNSVYKCISIQEIRDMLSQYDKLTAKEWFLDEVLNRSVNKLENLDLLRIQEYLSEIFPHELTGIELYITKCSDPFRKKLNSDYKANRKNNNYVSMVRNYYAENIAYYSDTLEADDLIANRVKDLGYNNCIIVSIDKDLKTIGGYYWSYYRQKCKDFDGNYITLENGIIDTEFKHNSVEFITEKEAEFNFYQQMLVGDSSDNIKGIKGIGQVKSTKLLNSSSNYFIQAARQYIEKSTKEAFRTNYKLLKLGTPQEDKEHNKQT
jgi:rRNA-processing protein FCF1